MKHFSLLIAVFALLYQLNLQAQQHNIIFETDMGNDIDDALAIDMLYKYHKQGKIHMQAVMLNKEGIYPAQFVDILNTWYGVKRIPIGLSTRSVSSLNVAVNYAQAICDMKDSKGQLLYKRTGRDCSQLPLAWKLYRKILSRSEDKSVTIISVGFSTNLATLLKSTGDEYSSLPGLELIQQKVKRLIVMAGNIEDPNYCEYNVINDIPACQLVFKEWPTDIYMSPFELGREIRYPSRSIKEDFGWTKHHPIVDAYKAFLPNLEDRPTWDLTAALYAIDPQDFFGVSPKGTISVTDKGQTHYMPSAEGHHYYLTTTTEQRKHILNYFIQTITRKP